MITPIDGGYRVAENETHYFDVMRMMFNWRVCLTPKACPQVVDLGFCYKGTDLLALLTAIAAAKLWCHEGTAEPPGWNKNVRTGEWRQDGQPTPAAR